ncbi:phosphatase PAP2 family protein [Pseudomonas zhanjiangensis]|uniref:Phosphatase PAP2 family protein n=1 Tax=Pseudomonas zhanjiangensis TaxID=3239015 RepID=A0ABV3YT49_9PSED
MPTDALPATRPFNFHLGFGLPVAIMLVLLLADPTGLDFAIAHWAYDPQTGFIGRHSRFLEDILHDRAKQAVILIGLLAIVGFVVSLLIKSWRHWRRPLGYLVLAMGLSTSYVTPVKALTGVHCPWSLSEFGGQETYTPLLSHRAPTDKPGRCWPGGHATAGFSLFALFFVLRDRRPRLAKAALYLALALGISFSVGRMLQGAHFFSHNLWTALFDWLISLGCYRLLLYRPALAPADALAAPAETGVAAG